MKRFINWVKAINYRHYICIVITAGFLLCTAFLFTKSINRIIEAFRDFGLSTAYYFCELFHIENGISATVTELPSLNLFSSNGAATVNLPDTWTGFKESFVAYWQLWASKDNFLNYLSFIGKLLYILCYVLLLIVPLVLIFVILFKRGFNKQNNDYAKDSKPLKVFKIITKPYRYIKYFLLSFIDFVRENRLYKYIWLFIWAVNFNVVTIGVEFVAFYLYFCVSFDFSSIYRQFYKLAQDLATSLGFIPLWIWVITGLVLFDRFRKKIAYGRLNHMERKNRGFINERPIVYMFCGSMGTQKTTCITDISLSREVMFRDKAFEKILENDLKFPYFPWINFENALKDEIAQHKVYNLSGCRVWVAYMRDIFGKEPCKENCFGYDYIRYPVTYDNKLTVVDLWEVLETYAQLYFIYIVQSSLIISNYAVRTDMLLADLGNFPVWNSDFFRRDSRLQEAYSRHSHILDFDSLRLGKRVVEDNKNADWFEFGIIDLTEIGKERKNSVELQGIKKLDEAANQKNDGFNEWLKLVRHSATVDYFPFVTVITDDQRPESWGADARELCDLIFIREKSEIKLAMPFFSLGELFYSFVFGRFTGLYSNYRFNRGDNTLVMYIIKTLATKLNSYYIGIYNRFGYRQLNLQVESGTQDGQFDSRKYFLMNKKIYSRRFSTDCYSDFFVQKALNSPVGIEDIPEYASEKATMDELESQNSYFINGLKRK